MKKKYLMVGGFTFMSLLAKSQPTKDSTRHKLNKTEVELVYNHYLQNGNNSAITGGIGTERLIVYGPAAKLKQTLGKNTVSLDFGADVVSSASTDNIDFIVSSASSLDARAHIQAGYERLFPSKNLSLNANLGSSYESDYFSLSGGIGIIKTYPTSLQTFSAQFQVFDDDLRWGRVNKGYYRPVRLIYPKELRYKDWYEGYKRNTYNLKLGYTQVLNKRNIIGIFPELSYQHGLLATPFHRVYFDDATLSVEQLPLDRYKAALALQLNSFIGGRLILKNTVAGYVDNFGIRSLSYEQEAVVKLKPSFALMPHFRLYTQKASHYFAPYGEHSATERYFSSDYDLSAFQNYSLGIGLKYAPQQRIAKHLFFNALIFRYQFMHRTNDLNAHTLSLVFQSSRIKPKRR